MIKNKFYDRKCETSKYSKELKKCIEDTYNLCSETLKLKLDKDELIKPIMLLGKIQSGKTNAYTGLIALAFDNSFDLVIILTKNNSALVKQTYKRMRNEFKEEIASYEINVLDIMKSIDSRLTNYELNKKIILIAKKQKHNLDKICNFIEKYHIANNKFCLIIDDEADTTSIGFEKKKQSDEFDLRAVASKINMLRGNLEGYAFVQVTATPYALYLQPDFSRTSIQCVKPFSTVLVPLGDNYIGGEHYFIESRKQNSPERFIYEEVSVKELEIVRLVDGDRRRFREEEILSQEERLTIFKRGIINFIVGGCILRMSDSTSHYSYVIHTNIEKKSHLRLETITQYFIDQLNNQDEESINIIGKLLQESYKDIKKSLEAYKQEVPQFSDVQIEFYKAITNDLISVSIVNSDKDTESRLNEDNGELDLRTPFSIFVGGQVLDRGITIPKMIGFYYGRNPKTMQQDTVLQHSRMFGYRDKKMLSVTRFYTTRKIFENLIKITEFDEELRKDIESNKHKEGIYFLQKDNDGQIIPCSPSKIRLSNVIFVKPGSRILPIGFTPICKSESKSILKEVDDLLRKEIFDNEGKVLISSEQVPYLVELIYKIIRPDIGSERFIKKDEFISLFNYLTNKDRKVFLIIRKNRKLSKFKDNGTSYSDAPDTPKLPKNELYIARQISEKYPVLMLIHQNGTGDGWNGREFWWPVLLVQKKISRIIFSLDEPSIKNMEAT